MKSLTIDDALDAIWAHVFDIASTATPKGSARMTVSMSDADGPTEFTYHVAAQLAAGGKITNFKHDELDKAVEFYNSITQGL